MQILMATRYQDDERSLSKDSVQHMRHLYPFARLCLGGDDMEYHMIGETTTTRVARLGG